MGNNNNNNNNLQQLLVVLALSSAAVLVVHGAEAENSECPTWTLPSSVELSDGSDCRCGDSVGQVVECDAVSLNVSLLMGNCMTYDNGTGRFNLASCPFKSRHESDVYTPLPRNVSELNDFICSPYNREGIVCSTCKPGYGPSVFTHNLECFKCSGSYHGWGLYLFFELFPVTVLFSIMVIFHIRLTSSGANCMLFTVQMIVAILSYGTHIGIYPFGTTSEVFRKIILTLYGFWSLDFFREVIPPFCVSEKINGLHSIALQYLSVVYLLVLTLSVFLVLEMNYRGNRVTMWLWKNVFARLIRVKQNWTLRTSLADSLATFLLLSYTRTITVSFNLIYPASIFDEHGSSVKRVLNFQENWEYFGPEHLPFAVLAIAVLVLLVIIPLLLFIVYPMKCCQRKCDQIGCHQTGLRHFVELFQGCFKDGTEGTSDFRCFSAFYFFFRFSMFISHIVGFGGRPRISFLLPGLVLLSASLTILIFRPYKKNLYNIVDGVILTSSSVLCFFQSIMVLTAKTSAGKILQIAIQIGFFLPLFFAVLYIVYLCIKLSGIKRCTHRVAVIRAQDTEWAFPDRILHPEIYAYTSMSTNSSHYGSIDSITSTE